MALSITNLIKSNRTTKDIKINKILPSIPFRLIIYAPSYSGKSNLILNLIKKKQFYKNIFKKNIFIFSKTAFDDYTDLNIPDNNIFDIFNYDVIQSIMEEQQKLIEQNINTNILFIIDDMITELSNNDKILKELYFYGRHYNISLILTSQTYHAVPKNIRLNSSHIILFKLPDDDIKHLTKELPINGDIFDEFYNECVSENYGFMYIDLKNKKYYCKFEYILKE
jgi:hypothetical protein